MTTSYDYVIYDYMTLTVNSLGTFIFQTPPFALLSSSL